MLALLAGLLPSIDFFKDTKQGEYERNKAMNYGVGCGVVILVTVAKFLLNRNSPTKEDLDQDSGIGIRTQRLGLTRTPTRCSGSLRTRSQATRCGPCPRSPSFLGRMRRRRGKVERGRLLNFGPGFMYKGKKFHFHNYIIIYTITAHHKTSSPKLPNRLIAADLILVQGNHLVLRRGLLPSAYPSS